MSDRFHHTLERKLDTKPDGADDEPRGVRRIELITGTGRRRRWSTVERSRILLESLEPDANVSEVARRNGLSPQQLFGWRREARAVIVDDAGAATGMMPPPDHATSVLRRPKRAKAKASGRLTPASGATSAFAPIMITAPAAAPPPSSDRTPCGIIEIVIGDTIVRVRGQVDASALAAVLKAVRRSS